MLKTHPLQDLDRVRVTCFSSAELKLAKSSSSAASNTWSNSFCRLGLGAAALGAALGAALDAVLAAGGASRFTGRDREGSSERY